MCVRLSDPNSGWPAEDRDEAELERREARLSATTTALTMVLAVAVMAALASDRHAAPLVLLGLAGLALATATALVVSVTFAVLPPGHPSWAATLDRKREHLRRGELAAGVGAVALCLAGVAQLAPV